MTERKVTFNELLSMTIERTENKLDYRFFQYWKFLDEDLGDRYNSERLEDEKRVKVNYIKDFCFDGRREWVLGYVMFDGHPTFFFYAYGRDGVDGYGHAVVDMPMMDTLNHYIKSLCTFEDYEITSVYNIDDDATFLTSFYGQSLFDEFKHWEH